MFPTIYGVLQSSPALPFNPNTPLTIPGSVTWYDAYLEGIDENLTHGQQVLWWNNRSTTLNPGDAYSAISRGPEYHENVFGTMPAMYFDGVNKYFRLPDFGYTTSYSIITVTKMVSTGGVFFRDYGTTGTIVRTMILAHASANYIAHRDSASVTNNIGKNPDTLNLTVTLAGKDWQTAYFRDEGSTVSNFVSNYDGSQTWEGTYREITLFCEANLTAFVNGWIAEFISYDHWLTAGELATLDDYLLAKYGKAT